MKIIIALVISMFFSVSGYAQKQEVVKNEWEYGIGKIPEFSDSRVQEFVVEYDMLMQEYLITIHNNDFQELIELNNKAQELIEKNHDISEKLVNKEEDLNKYNIYIQNVAQTIQYQLSNWESGDIDNNSNNDEDKVATPQQNKIFK